MSPAAGAARQIPQFFRGTIGTGPAGGADVAVDGYEP